MNTIPALPNEPAKSPPEKPCVLVGQKEKYAATVALMCAAEASSVNRFNVFLVISAILAAGWVALASRPESFNAKVVMTIFCLLGLLAGLVWAGIGGRSRSYVEMYRIIGERLEKESDRDSHSVNSPCIAAGAFKPFSKNEIRIWMENNAGANKLFFGLPIAVGITFICLSCITWIYPLVPRTDQPITPSLPQVQPANPGVAQPPQVTK